MRNETTKVAVADKWLRASGEPQSARRRERVSRGERGERGGEKIHYEGAKFAKTAR